MVTGILRNDYHHIGESSSPGDTPAYSPGINVLDLIFSDPTKNGAEAPFFVPSSAMDHAPKLLATKSQLTRFQKFSTYLGRRLR